MIYGVDFGFCDGKGRLLQPKKSSADHTNTKNLRNDCWQIATLNKIKWTTSLMDGQRNNHSITKKEAQ